MASPVHSSLLGVVAIIAVFVGIAVGRRSSRRERGKEEKVNASIPCNNLFSTLQLGDLILKNRIVMAPLTRARSGLTKVVSSVTHSITLIVNAFSHFISSNLNVMPWTKKRT